MEDLLEETQRDLEAEKNEKIIWSSVRVLAIVSLIFLAFFAVYNYLKTIEKANAEKEGDLFIQAQQLIAENKKDLALGILESINGSSSYGSISLIERAKIKISLGKTIEAKDLLEKLINDRKADDFFKNLAIYHYIQAGFNLSENHIKSLRSNSPFYLSILYSKLLVDLGNGDFSSASRLLTELRKHPDYSKIKNDTIINIENFINLVNVRK